MIATGNWRKIKDSTWSLRLPVHDYYRDSTYKLRSSLQEKFPDALVHRTDVYPSIIRCDFEDQYEDVVITFNNEADEAFFILTYS